MKDNFWKSRTSRRQVMRGAALGTAGLGAAALIGCGGDDDSAATPAATTAAPGATQVPGQPDSQAGGAGGTKGGTLRVAGWGVRDFISPRAITGGNFHDVLNVMGDSYVYIKANGSYDASVSLWESWEQVDGDTIVGTLRQGVQFHDDTPFNSEAVKAHLEFMSVADNVPQYGFFSLLDNLDSVEAIDEHTVQVRTRQPDASFLGNIALAPGVPFSLAQIQNLGEDELTRPALTGPYKVDSYRSDEGWTWVKNDQYWGDPDGAPLPDRIEYTGPADQTVRALGLEAGDVDVAWFGASDENTLRLSQDNRFQNRQLSVAPVALQINYAMEPLDDLRVRKALAHTLNAQQVAQIVYRGQSQPATTGILAPGTFGALEYNPHPFDLSEARKYLDAAGAGTSINLKYGYGGAGTQEVLLSVQVYQEAAREVGITIDIVNYPQAGAAAQAFRDGEYHLIHGSTGVRPDPSQAYGLTHASWGSLNRPGGELTTEPVQEEIDDLILRSMAEFEPSAREEIFHELHRVTTDNLIGRIQVAERTRWLFAQPSVGGMDHPEVVNAPGGAGYRIRHLWMNS